MAGQYIKKMVNKRLTAIWKSITGVPFAIRRFYNKKKIQPRNFTVISNNCWAGKLYQYLDMPYLSPTVGLYFFADDYLLFVKNLWYYMSQELNFISVDESKYKDELIARHHDAVPLGKLDDVEIVFLHYATKEEAEEKWNRRKQRINWENIYYKFSKMNYCSEDHLKKFSELPFQHKFMLNNRKTKRYDCEFFWSGDGNDEEILSDTKPFPGNVKLTKLLRGEKNANC